MIALHEPRFDAADEANILEAIRSSWVSTGGPFVDRFEKEFAKYVGVEHAISVSNGTLALFLILEVLRREGNWSEQFDVIVPTLTFIATGNAVVQAGGVPVYVDVAPESMNVDPVAIGRLIDEDYSRDSKGVWRSRSTKRPLLAVMPAHLMGWTCDMIALAKICSDRGVTLVEDAAEALGCFEKSGPHVGRRGKAAGFSFNGNKILTTGGGGMIVTNDAIFAKRAKHLSTTAKTDGLRFVHDEPGYNFRLVNPLAALGCSQLAKLPQHLERKQQIDRVYRTQFAGTPIQVHREGDGVSNHWIVNLRFDSFASRERAMAALLEKQIQCRPLWTPLHMQPAYSKITPSNQTFPRADALWKTTLSMPSSPHLSDAEIIQMSEVVKGATLRAE